MIGNGNQQLPSNNILAKRINQLKVMCLKN